MLSISRSRPISLPRSRQSGSSETPSSSAAGLDARGVEDRLGVVDVHRELAAHARRAGATGSPSSASAAAGGSTARTSSTFPFRTRCSPWKKPLSEVKRTSVLSSSPVCAQRLDDRRDRFVHRHQRLAALLPVLLDRCDRWRALSSGRRRMTSGLSETSASLKFGGCGSGVPFERVVVPRCWIRRRRVRVDRPGSRGPPEWSAEERDPEEERSLPARGAG